jgi:hypothetical protein
MSWYEYQRNFTLRPDRFYELAGRNSFPQRVQRFVSAGAGPDDARLSVDEHFGWLVWSILLAAVLTSRASAGGRFPTNLCADGNERPPA